jgi:hypothetical protein
MFFANVVVLGYLSPRSRPKKELGPYCDYGGPLAEGLFLCWAVTGLGVFLVLIESESLVFHFLATQTWERGP